MKKDTQTDTTSQNAGLGEQTQVLAQEMLKPELLTASQLLELRVSEIEKEARQEAETKAKEFIRPRVQGLLWDISRMNLDDNGSRLCQNVNRLLTGNLLQFAYLARWSDIKESEVSILPDSPYPRFSAMTRAVVAPELHAPTEELQEDKAKLVELVSAGERGELVPVVPFRDFLIQYLSTYVDFFSVWTRMASVAVKRIEAALESGLLPGMDEMEITQEMREAMTFLQSPWWQTVNPSQHADTLEKHLHAAKSLGMQFVNWHNKLQDSRNFADISLPSRTLEKIQTKVHNTVEQYRRTDEARILRMCRELEDATEISSAAKKTAKQLSNLPVSDVLSILGGFKHRLRNYDSLKVRIKDLLSEPKAGVAAEEPKAAAPGKLLAEEPENASVKTHEDPAAVPRAVESRVEGRPIEYGAEEHLVNGQVVAGEEPKAADSVEPLVAESQKSSAESQEDPAAVRRALEAQVEMGLIDCGVEDHSVMCLIIAGEDLDEVSRCIGIVKAYEDIPLAARGLLIQTNPAIVTGKLEVSLSSFLKQVGRTIDLAQQLPGYEDAFGIEQHPEHYAFPNVLQRTNAAAAKLLELVQEARVAYEESAATADDASTEKKLMPEGEQRLIEELNAYVDNPYAAYAIMRFAFYQKNGYLPNAVSKHMRDQRLKSVFIAPGPDPREVRAVERQLLQLGLLQDDIRSTKSQGNLKLGMPSDIENSTLRRLLVALTDNETTPKGKIPRLPFQ